MWNDERARFELGTQQSERREDSSLDRDQRLHAGRDRETRTACRPPTQRNLANLESELVRENPDL